MRYSAAVKLGYGRGKVLGFPTLNLVIPDTFDGKDGIYAGWVVLDGKKYMGAFHLGPIPTFNHQERSLEVFLLDTNLEKTPQAIEFELIEHIRPVMHFSDAETLKAQIQKDVEEVRKKLV